jgi:hypothetical protein
MSGNAGRAKRVRRRKRRCRGNGLVAERDDRRSNFNQSIPSNLGYPAADATYYTAMMLEIHGIY